MHGIKPYKCFKVIFIALLFFPHFAISQSKGSGSIEYLKSCNGFSKIVLGADINLVSYDKLVYLDNNNKIDADSCLMYEFRYADALKISDDLYLDLIGFRTYKNKIVNIYLFFKRSDGYKVLRKFLSDYGVFTSKPSDYVDIYDWRSSAVNLSLNYELKVDLGVATFTCNKIENEILEKRYKDKLGFQNVPLNK